MIKIENSVLLNERGLDCFNHNFILRQLDLGPWGRSDIIGITKKGFREYNITVYELKRDELKADTLVQANRYLTALKRFINEKFLNKIKFNFDIVLIGSEIDNYETLALFSFIPSLKIYDYTFDIKGLYFNLINIDSFELEEKGYGSLDRTNLKNLYKLMHNEGNTEAFK